MQVDKIQKSVEINGKVINFQLGEFAPQADAAVLVTMGETVVLATVVTGKTFGDLNFVPLSVEYQEKLYAGGIIKGSRWVKREGRPSDESILTARLIDRSIRPLFPDDYRTEVQVVITVLSFDGENDPDILSICAASAALSVSNIPWEGPAGALRLGYKDSKFLVNPGLKEREKLDLNLVVSATKGAIVMVEAGAQEVSEQVMVDGLTYGHKEIQKIVEAVLGLQKEAGTEKVKITPAGIDEFRQTVGKEKGKELKDLIVKMTKDIEEEQRLSTIKEELKELYPENKEQVEKVVDDLFKDFVRDQILTEELRLDGRGPNEIRPLNIKVGILPRTHGSAIFQRGKTQALTITTLGSPTQEQWIESLAGEDTKRYMHHYYMPPYSVGEVGRFGWPSRREVGHGALGERALLSVIPSEEEFPYTIRVVSELMSSNGSTSMAAVCGSSLSLMDAGVPIKKPVAGIAMGLIAKSLTNKQGELKQYIILTDIAGLEDHFGDMDFKVAGTQDGITALQMDVKIVGLTPKILSEALNRAKEARLFLLSEMKKVIPAPRDRVSQYAPKVEVVKISKEQIGDVIGPGGRIIRQIITETGVSMDVDDEGKVTISAPSVEAVLKAVEWVKGLTRDVQVGEEFEGVVKRIVPFGAFVEVLPSKEGLVHVSKMSVDYVDDPNKIVSLGQKVKVKVDEIDSMGRINLTMLTKGEKRSPQGQNHQNFNRSFRQNSRPRHGQRYQH